MKKYFLIFILLISVTYSTMLTYNAPFCGGTGTLNEPYLICTAQSLIDIQNDLNSHYKLENNIDLQEIEWIPIGNETHPFRGYFNGDGYNISNLNIQKNERFTGVFGVSEGTISNLNLINVNVSGRQDTGALVGKNYNLIENVYVKGYVKGSSQVGGLVGSNIGTILDSKTYVVVEGNKDVGGLVGYNNGLYNNGGIIKKCSSIGEIYGKDNTGGLIGDNTQGEEIYDCYSISLVEGNDYVGGLIGSCDKSSISNSYFIGNVKGRNLVGGFIGGTSLNKIIQSYTNSNITGEKSIGGFIGKSNGDYIDKSYSKGSVFGNRYVGGFIGYMSGIMSHLPNNTYKTTTTEITKSYSDSEVIGERYVGGFIGESRKGNIKNSYSKGSVEGEDHIGGFIGVDGDVEIINSYTNGKVNNPKTDGFYGNPFFSKRNSNITHSFYDKDVISQSEEEELGKTTKEMKDIKTYSKAGWDIKYTNINKNNGYPFLAWEGNESEGVWLIYTPNTIDNKEIIYDDINDEIIHDNTKDEKEEQKIENADWDYILLAIGFVIALIVIFLLGVKYLKNK
jgi:hypothetical protein